MKPGLVWLASHTGLPVLPVVAAARAVRELKSWDRFRVPLPFTRIAIRHGARIAVPDGLEGSALELWRRAIESELERLTREADRAMREGA